MIKTLFKVQFESGKTYYGLHKVKSVKSFIRTNVQLGKFHLENPHIHTITNFEELLLNEGFECTIVEVGNDTNMATLRDQLVQKDTNCINYKKSLTNIKKKEKNTPLVVKKEYVKSVKNSKGEVLNFIEKTFGIKKGLTESMKFGILHPLKSNFCLTTANIKVVG